MSDSVTYREVKEEGQPAYWVALLNGKQIAKSMSEQGVRSMVLTIVNKEKSKKANG